MSKLSKDILYLIFEELQGDTNSLFSCLLVNRLWCEAVVPILWKDPWYRTNIVSKSNRIINLLYNIFTLILYDNSEEFLTSNVQFSRRPLLFDYPSFFRCINASAINKMSLIYSSSASDQLYFQQEIYGLIMSKCTKLKYLDMRSLQHQIFIFPESINLLQSLCELKCDTIMESAYFYGIARICQSIQRLFIDNSSSKGNDGVVCLIEAQRNLKYFEWYDDLDVDYSNVLDDYYMKISSALKKNADTLIYFINHIDYFTNKLSKVLPEFHNLKVLILNVVTDVLEYHLKTSRFQHLEVLQIDYITINTVNCLIRNNGGRLKLIFICEPEIFDHDESLTFIRTVRENCSLIEYLSPVFITSDDHIIEFEHLLMTCQKLKLLMLAKYNNYYLDEDITYEKRMMASGEKILNVLINSAPISLNVIGTIYGCKFSINILRKFFENWKGRPALSFITSKYGYDNEEYTKLIDKYKDNVVINECTYSYMERIVDYFRS